MRGVYSLTPPTAVPLSPLGGGADDGARITALLALGWSLALGAGTYTIATPVQLVSGSAVYLSSRAVLHSTMVSTGDQSKAVFNATDNATLRTNATTLASTITAGTRTLVLASATGYAVGDDLIVGGADGPQAGYTIAALSGATVTTDRPIRRAFASGTAVVRSHGFVRDVSIVGERGALITGTGDHGLHAVMAQRVYVRGLRVDASFGLTCLDLDWATVDSLIEDCHVESTSDVYGILIEDAERTFLERCVVTGTHGAGIGIVSCMACAATDCTVDPGSNVNFYIRDDDGDTTWGSREITLTRCRSYGATTYGVQADAPTHGGGVGRNITLVDCDVQWNAVAFSSTYQQNTIRGGYYANSTGQAFTFGAGIVSRFIGVRTENNNTANAGSLVVGVIDPGAGSSLTFVGLDSTETTPLLVIGVACTISISQWRYGATVNGQMSAIFVNGGSGATISVDGLEVNHAGTGYKTAFLATAAATWWLNRVSSVGTLAAAAYADVGTFYWGMMGLRSMGGSATVHNASAS